MKLPRMARSTLMVGVLFLASSSLHAHPYWILPSAFSAARGSTVTLALRIGPLQTAVPYPRNPFHIVDFFCLSPDGRAKVPGKVSMDPAGSITIGRAGAYVACYHSVNELHAMDAEPFEAYLNSVGLERIVAYRHAHGDADRLGRELFSRCAKAMIVGGDSTDAGYNAVAGLPLEFIPGRDPHAMQPGDTLPMRVLFNGKPLEGLKVMAYSAVDSTDSIATRSDAAGNVRIAIDRGGMWLVTGTHMIPAPDPRAADWASIWSSLTFLLPEPRPR